MKIPPYVGRKSSKVTPPKTKMEDYIVKPWVRNPVAMWAEARHNIYPAISGVVDTP